MTDKETIKTIEIAISEVEWDYPMEYAIAFERAILALEKQVPKKIERHNDGTHFCPECGNTVKSYQNYCYECGQRLSWRNDIE